ncbi:uncharacterized protein N7483_010435 [Penicillium malachiteum]|uniref:uncharacterized protein n=1 Tax=Penicillium malachiteum TaxID=1324776 RepID=UPI00254749E7|nr:uncharacterized protein N7483_010435 [Penicillium malachiteum]KAJ5713254.1 hypothetical protein N7483_010435 [Penicillium malachiteum]
MPRIPTGTKLSDLEEGLLPWVSAKPPERPSTSTAKECEVKLDDLNGLFFSQGARYGIHDILRGNHIVGISRREPYNYDNYHRQYRPPFPPEPRAPRRYDQDRRARKYNLHSFQRETLEEESIFYSPNDRTEPKTERPTSEDVRSREKHILIIQDNSKSKGKKVETSSSSHQLPGSGSNNSHEPGATGFKSEDILSNDQASQIVEEKNESLNQRTEASSVSDELSETGSNSSHDSMGSTSRPRRSRDRRAEDYYSDDLWNARLYESDRRRASPQTPYAPYFSTRPPMPYHPQMPQYYYPQISPEPQMSDYTPMPPPPRAVPPPLIPDPPQTLLPYTYTAPSHIPEEIQAKEKQKTLKSSKLSDLKFHDRLTAAGINAVYYRSPPEEPLSYNIALNSLQRMVMHELQGELVGVVQKIVQKQGVEQDLMENARELLGKYSMWMYHGCSGLI